ncbi:MAG: hypothetical protein ACI8UR_001396 [Natronomonas sp.]|uniref:hypothetical protein n=1 Tax=Natronomonas sp. TaxID=2184060 RepID=UPI003988E3CB
MRRAATILVAVLLVLSIMPPTVGAVPDARLTIDGAAVAPDRPTTDEPTTVSADISLSAGSNSAVELTRITLRDEDGNRLASADTPGSLSPGDSVSVDLVAEFADAGRQNLTLVARGTDADGNTVTAERPVTVVIEDSPPGITIDADLVEGVASPVEVEIANPAVDPVRNVEVVALKGDSTVDRGFVATLASGASTTVNLSVRPDGSQQTVGIRVGYTTATGDRQTTVRRETLRVEPLEDDVGIDVRQVRNDDSADTQAGGGISSLIGGGGGAGLQQQSNDEEEAPNRVEVAVTNFGNAPVSEAVVEPSGEERLPRQFVGDLEPGETETVTLNLADVPPGELDIAVSYRLDREQRRTSTTYDHRPSTAAVSLTGVDIERDGDQLRISGNAGNTGEAKVTGVVVSVADAEGVQPVYPQRDYFIGTIDGSEFAPFELTASVDANATAIPVEVTYRVDGRQVTDRPELPVEPVDDSDSGGVLGSFSPLALGLGAGASAVVGVGIFLPLYYWRR